MALIAMAALGGLGGLSAHQRGKGRIKQLQLQEDNFYTQADIAESIGAFEAHLFRRRARHDRGQIPAVQAASGIRVGTGSALDSQIIAAQNNKSEELQITFARELQAWGLRENANNVNKARHAAKQQKPLDIIGGALSFASIAR